MAPYTDAKQPARAGKNEELLRISVSHNFARSRVDSVGGSHLPLTIGPMRRSVDRKRSKVSQEV
jgi:hypothetical protein